MACTRQSVPALPGREIELPSTRSRRPVGAALLAQAFWSKAPAMSPSQSAAARKRFKRATSERLARMSAKCRGRRPRFQEEPRHANPCRYRLCRLAKPFGPVDPAAAVEVVTDRAESRAGVYRCRIAGSKRRHGLAGWLLAEPEPVTSMKASPSITIPIAALRATRSP